MSPLDSQDVNEALQLICGANTLFDPDFELDLPHPLSLTPEDMKELLEDDLSQVRVYTWKKFDKIVAVLTYLLEEDLYRVLDLSWLEMEGAVGLLGALEDKAGRGNRRRILIEIPDGLYEKIHLCQKCGYSCRLSSSGDVWLMSKFIPKIVP